MIECFYAQKLFLYSFILYLLRVIVNKNRSTKLIDYHFYIIWAFIVGEKTAYSYIILGDIMCPNRNYGGGLFTILAIFALSVLIFYQVLITLILPIRFNIFILFLEVSLLFYFLFRIIYPRC